MSHALASLRLARGIEVAESEGQLWIRGTFADAPTLALIAGLPATARYTWLIPHDRLQPAGSLLASDRFPESTWRPLQEWLATTAPVARYPTAQPRPLQLELRRTHEARPANAALAELDAFLIWARHAPAIRLSRLRFAASDRGRALVLGTPLPPMPLTACVESGGVVVPAGFTWHPQVSSAVVRRVMGAPEGAIVLWDQTGTQLLPGELFVAATRANARLTMDACHKKGTEP